MNILKGLLALVALAWAAAACATLPPTGDAGAPQPAASPDVLQEATITAPTPPEQVDSTPAVVENGVPGEPGVPVNNSSTEMESRARDDLSAFLGVDAAAIETVSLEERTWREGLQSCVARRGMFETVEPVQGWRIVLQAQGRVFEYRAGEDGRLIRCPQSAKPLDPIR